MSPSPSGPGSWTPASKPAGRETGGFAHRPGLTRLSTRRRHKTSRLLRLLSPPAHPDPPKRAGLTGQVVRYLNRTYRVLPTVFCAISSGKENCMLYHSGETNRPVVAGPWASERRRRKARGTSGVETGRTFFIFIARNPLKSHESKK
jgi:hypothetical protein